MGLKIAFFGVLLTGSMALRMTLRRKQVDAERAEGKDVRLHGANVHTNAGKELAEAITEVDEEVTESTYAQVNLSHKPKGDNPTHSWNDSTTPLMLSRGLPSVQQPGSLVLKWLQQLAERKPTNVIVFGGSVTDGTWVKHEEKWTNQFSEWLTDSFGRSEVHNFANGGLTSCRLLHQLDAIFDQKLAEVDAAAIILELGLNDGQLPSGGFRSRSSEDEDNDGHAETMNCFEAIVRKLRTSRPNAALILLELTSQRALENTAQEEHTQIAKAYGLPVISWKDAVLPTLKADRDSGLGYFKDWKEMWKADDMHFSAWGHRIAAHLLAEYIMRGLQFLDQKNNVVEVEAFPEFPIHGQRVSMLERRLLSFYATYDNEWNEKLVPMQNSGFENFADVPKKLGWISDKRSGGDTISFRTASSISNKSSTSANLVVILGMLCSYNGMGKFRVSIRSSGAQRPALSFEQDGLWSQNSSQECFVHAGPVVSPSLELEVNVTTLPQQHGRIGNKVKVTSLAVAESKSKTRMQFKQQLLRT